MGEPPGAEDFQMAEVVALGQPSGAEDFLGTGQGSASARGRVPRLLLLLLLLRQGARSFCCGLKAEVVLERGGCSSLLHHTGEKSIKSLEVNSVQVVRKNGNVMRVPTPAAGRCGVGAGGCGDACRPRGPASRPSKVSVLRPQWQSVIVVSIASGIRALPEICGWQRGSFTLLPVRCSSRRCLCA